MVISSTGHSKVWDTVFATEQLALNEYQGMVDAKRVAQSLGIGTALEDALDLNPALLKPHDQRMRDPQKLATYTIRKFEIIKKYSGVWPIKNMAGHNITGYLYLGAPPAWPHPPKDAPGAPSHIDTEFTVATKHIDFYLSHDRRLQKMLTNWYV